MLLFFGINITYIYIYSKFKYRPGQEEEEEEEKCERFSTATTAMIRCAPRHTKHKKLFFFCGERPQKHFLCHIYITRARTRKIFSSYKMFFSDIFYELYEILRRSQSFFFSSII